MKAFLASDFIAERKLGKDHSEESLRAFVTGFLKGDIPDYQVTAWLMATYFKPLSQKTTAVLTKVMKNSGEVVSFGDNVVVDKHSTGGVGDKTTMITDPIVAACGLPVASIAGRGLGHTGGTLDKLESIKGMDVFLPTQKFTEQVQSLGLSIIGQTENMVPADKKLYSLRDVTQTVDSIPLISASIMSKKLAEGVKGLVLDVKYGTGAFMKSFDQALELAQWLKAIGEQNGVTCHALITNMHQPLGRFAGNSLEILECIEILKGKSKYENGLDFYEDTRELSLQLAAHMLIAGNKFKDVDDAYNAASDALTSGKALSVFRSMCSAQGAANIEDFEVSDLTSTVVAARDGWISEINTTELGMACVQLKAGRARAADIIDPTTGLELHVKLGQPIKKGSPLVTLYHNETSDQLFDVRRRVESAFSFSYSPVEPIPLIQRILI